MEVASIILATYNEAENLPELLIRIQNSANFDFQVIFVDDGSTDGTRDLILNYCKSHNGSRYIFRDNKNGTAIARYSGIMVATGHYIIIMDSDLQHAPEKIVDLYQSLEEGYDFAICSRYILNASAGNRMPIRGVISRTATLIAKLALKSARSLSDPLSNFVAFKSTLVVPRISWYGYEIQLAILSNNDNLKIKEIPYKFHERENGMSSITSSLTFPINFMREMLIYAKMLKKHRNQNIIRR